MKKLIFMNLLFLSHLAIANKYYDDGSESGNGLGAGVILLIILVAAFYVGDRETKKHMLSFVFKTGLVVSYLILCFQISQAIVGKVHSPMGILLFVIFYFVPLIIWWNSTNK